MSKKKPSGKRPAMFYQPGLVGSSSNDLVAGDRIRIVYPDGNVEWCTLAQPFSIPTYFDTYEFESKPCYIDDGLLKVESFAETMKFLKDYDKRKGRPKMIFMGEL